MKPDFGFLSRKPGKLTNAGKPGFLVRFIRDERGSYIAFMALLLPALVTIAALGSEGGYYLYNHRVVQSAADNAAFSVAAARARSSATSLADLTSQAKAVPLISAATLSASLALRSQTATFAPAAASFRAVAAPSPDAPPVTTAA